MTGPRTPLHAAATFGQIEVMKLLIRKGSDPNVFHDHGFHAIFQLLITANFLSGGEKLVAVDWVIRKQEIFEFDVQAVDVLGHNLAQLIIKTDPSTTGGAQQTSLVDALLMESLCLDNQDFEGSTALPEATKIGRLDLVERLLNAFAKPTIKDNRGRTPLHNAASLGNVAIVRRLLGKSNAGINDEDVTGWTPLRLAVTGHHLDTVKLLVCRGALCDDVLLKDAVMIDAEDLFDYFLTIGANPTSGVLFKTINSSNLSYLRKCILAGASPDSISRDCTALTFAVGAKRPLAVQLLLSMGANANLRMRERDSALLLAIRSGELVMVDILLRAGAATHDLSFKESPTVNLIKLATNNGYADIAEMLDKAGAPKPATDQVYANTHFDMRSAAIQNRVDILTELIRQSGNVNEVDDVGCLTPLSLACRWGSAEAAILLINAGADLSIQAGSCPPAVFDAAAAGLTEVVQSILRKGPDVNELNFQGQTALLYMFDVEQGFPNDLADQNSYDQALWIVKRLILAGISVNVVDKNGHTALGMVCSHGYTSVVKMLLEAGADLRIPSVENLEFSADIDPNNDSISQTGNRYLPLDLAARAGHEDIVQLLLAKGAD